MWRFRSKVVGLRVCSLGLCAVLHARGLIFPRKYIEYGVYGKLIAVYPTPYSIT